MAGLALIATVWVGLVATLALGLARAAGKPRPTPPQVDIEPHLITALHEEAERLIREHER